MVFSGLAPTHRWWAVLSLSVFLIIATLSMSLSQMVPSAVPVSGNVLSSSQGEVTLNSTDFALEPGDLKTYVEFNDFMSRQDLIVKTLGGDDLQLKREEAAEAQPIEMRKRSLGDLPLDFWIQVIVALGSLLIAGGIWVLKPDELGPRFFLLSAVALAFSSLASAVYTTRPLAISSDVFKILVSLNSAGATGFGVFMVALFTVYPFKFQKWKLFFVLSVGIFSIWTGLFLLQKMPESFLGMGGIILVLMSLILLAIAVQFVRTRKDPKNKAILLWIGLSVVLGSGGFVAVNVVPLALGLEPWEQGYAFFSFLLIYLGIAAGLKQYRLFEVGQWAYRIGFYALGAILIVIVDALLIIFGMGRLPALGVALLFIGFLYLPLRDSLWRWMSSKKEPMLHELLEKSLHVALAPSPQQRTQRWHLLLKQSFDPLEFSLQTEEQASEVALSSDGVSMTLPAVAGSSVVRMSYPFSGKALFNPTAVKMAQSLVSFVAQAESSRNAYDRGVSEERLRIAQDLHDNVGARLLTGLHSSESDVKSTIRDAITDIRTIVQGITGESSSLTDLLADLRSDTQRRLQAVNIQLEWPLDKYAEIPVSIDYRLYKTVSSCVREIVSNTIRHAQAHKLVVLVSIEEAHLIIEASDDGKGFETDGPHSRKGFGLRSIEKRMTDLNGTYQVLSSTQGLKILLRLPLS